MSQNYGAWNRIVSDSSDIYHTKDSFGRAGPQLLVLDG